MKYAVGIDIGGTNIQALAVTQSGRVLANITAPTGDDGGRIWINNVRAVKERICVRLKKTPAWTGIAAPGLAAKDQRSISCMPGRLAGLEGLNWGKVFKTTNTVPVLNDAHAALMGEVWRGAAQKSSNAILLTLGTGVGGAAMVDGRLLRGHIGRAGHFGHISLDPEGAGDIANTPGSLEDAIGDCTIRARTRGKFSSTQQLVAASRRNNRDAQLIWQKSVQALAAGIASLINVLDPEVVVIGGGISKAGKALFRPLNQYLDKYEWRPGAAEARIVPAKLGDRAGAFGAAWNAIHFQP
ncbi:MAG TPA: ROK family protein [Verrucomicrobiae bacterium]|jgi:glucokinase